MDINDGFLNFLYSKKKLSEEQVKTILDIQFHEKPPVGTIARELGLLSNQDIMEIIQIQINNENKIMFGELAVKLGKLTTEQVSKILEKQNGKIPESKDILMRKKFIPAAECVKLFLEFQSQE